jgi:hypothetical protein
MFIEQIFDCGLDLLLLMTGASTLFIATMASNAGFTANGLGKNIIVENVLNCLDCFRDLANRNDISELWYPLEQILSISPWPVK